MTDNMLNFEWPVIEQGYYWRDTREVRGDRSYGPTRPYLQFAEDIGHFYEPLREVPALFLIFAATPPNRQGILDFANKYGMLGKHVWIVPEEGLKSGIVKFGEPFPVWVKEIKHMRQAIELWRGRRNINRLLRLVNDQLAGYVIEADPPPGFKTPISPMLLQDAGGKLRFAMMPHSLVSAMWWQFIQAIDGEKEYRRCALVECGTWFEARLERGERRKYCSDACRFKRYRRRKKSAQKRRKKR
jgi:hypothetical protein